MYTETEQAFVLQLISSYDAAHEAGRRVGDVADELEREIAGLHARIAVVNVQLAKRALCRAVDDSRRRGELIKMSAWMADGSERFAPVQPETPAKPEKPKRQRQQKPAPTQELEADDSAQLDDLARMDAGEAPVDAEYARDLHEAMSVPLLNELDDEPVW